MKCRNCGYTFHGVVCPLCGKKNIGIRRCSVCGEVIPPGSSQCLHCGNPMRDHNESTTISSNSVSTSKHSLESHTYTFEEGYDYKKNAYEYQEKAKKLKKMFINQNSPIVQAIAIILVSILIMVVVSLSVKEEVPEYQEPEDIIENIDEGISIQGEMTDLQKQSNYLNLQVLDMIGEDIYFNDFSLYKTDRNFIVFNEIENIIVNSNFCVDGEKIYYVDIYDGICVRNNGIKTVIDENGINLQKVGQELYYQDQNHTLYCYNTDTKKSKLVSKDVYYYFVDLVNEKIYFNDYDDKIKQMNLDGTQIGELGIEGESFIVDGNIIYIKQWEDIDSYNLRAYAMDSNKYTMTYHGNDIDRIARNEDSFIFNDDSGKIYRLSDTSKEKELLFDVGKEIYSFQLIGDKIIIGVFDEAYNTYWYISDYNGNYARIITG